MPNTMFQPTGQNPASQPPPPPPIKKRFRWEVFILLPAAILTFLWIKHGIVPAFQFAAVLNLLNIVNKGRFVQLMTLGIICVVIVIVYKALTRNSGKS